MMDQACSMVIDCAGSGTDARHALGASTRSLHELALHWAGPCRQGWFPVEKGLSTGFERFPNADKGVVVIGEKGALVSRPKGAICRGE